MNNTHINIIAKAKRLVASVLMVALCLQDATPAFAITFDSATSDYFDTVDDFGLSSGSENISVRFGTTLGEFLRFNRSADKFILSNDLDVRGTLSGSALTIMGGVSYLLGNVGIGTSATPDTKLEVVGTISGSSLKITGTAAISGALVLEGGSTLSGAALRGFGLLTDCDNSVTSKLLWDSTTGRFSCGTDQTGGSSGGLSLSDADARYVNTAGDTMTGKLILNTTSISVKGSGTIVAHDPADIVLVVRGTGSQTGNLQEWVDSAGTPVANIAANGNLSAFNGSVSSTMSARFLTSSDSLDTQGYTILGSDSADTISFNAYANTEFMPSVNANYNIGGWSNFWNYGYFTNLNVSGVTNCNGANSLATDVSGLVYCDIDDNAGYDNWGSGYFNISDGTTSEGIYSADQILFADGTGINAVVSGTDTVTISSSNLYANDMNQNVGSDDSVTFDGLVANGTVLLGSDASDSIAFNGLANTSILNSANNTYNIGDSTNRWATGWFHNLNVSDTGFFGGNLSVAGTLILNPTNADSFVEVRFGGNDRTRSLAYDNSIDDFTLGDSLRASGSLLATGTLSGARLYGLGLVDCDTGATSKLLWDATTGRFSCGTDQTGGSSGGSYFAGQGLSLNGANSFSLNAAVTGSTIHAVSRLSSSGTAIIHGADAELTIFTSADVLKPSIVAKTVSSAASQVFQNVITGDTASDGFEFGNYYSNVFLMNRESAGMILGTGNTYHVGINSAGSVGIGGAYDVFSDPTVDAKLEVNGTISGASFFAGSFYQGTGLSDCDNATTSKLLWDSTNGRFSCGTDQTGGSSGGGISLDASGTGSAITPLVATSLKYGTILMGTGSMKAGSGKFMPQLHVAGRLPVLIGSGATTSVPRGIVVQGDYAYVAGQTAMQIFNVTIPGSPKLVGSISSSTAYGLAVQGEYVYLATSNSVHIINVSNPVSPTTVSFYEDVSCITGTAARDVVVQGRYAYVSCYSASTIQVLDISDPVRPRRVGTVGSSNPYELHMQGNYLYAAISTGLQVIDVTDPTRPFQAGSLATGTTPQGVYVQGRYAYVSNYGSHTVSIVDVTNPTSPILTSTWSTGSSTGPQNVAVEGRFMYVTNYDNHTFQTVDVANPNAPYLIGNVTFPTTSSPHSIAIQGRYAYVTLALRSRIQVLDLGGTYTQALEAGSAKFGSVAISNKLSGMDAVFRGGLAANSLMVENGAAINGGSGAYALKVNTGGILMNGGTFTVLPSMSPRTMSGIDLNANVNAVFITGNYAYTVSDSVTGNEYRAIDIANPNAPVIVGGFDTGQNTKALFVSTRHAFIGMNGSGAGSGMYILDNGNPGTPTVVGRLNFGKAVNFIYVSGKYAYVGLSAATSGVCMAKYQLYSGCDFAIVDFTDANRPKVIGGLQIGANVNQMHIQNRYAYLAIDSVSGNDFRIIDIANPLSPIAVGGLDVSNNVKSVYASGKYAFIGLSTDASTEFRVIDVSNKTSPVSIGGVEVGAAVQSIIVTGDWGRIGLSSAAGNDMYTVDLRAPTAPSLYGGVDFGAGVNDVMVAGKYGYVGLSSISGNDFRIIDLAGIEAPSATIGSLATGHLFASDNVRFDNNAYIRNALNVGRGGIISKGALSIQSTGTGSAKGGTGQLLNAFDVRNGTGQHLFSVSENGTVQGGIPSFSTGTMMIALNMMSRRSGYCTPLITSATTFTSVGMSTCTVNGTATAWPAGGRMKLKIAAANTANAMGGITTVFTETRSQFRPKTMFDVTTGTGTTGLRFWGGIVESSTAALAPTVASAATTIDYAALAWEDGISGTQWLCCSGDGTNHSCQSMGVPVQTSTEYMGQVDWSQPGRVTCSLQVRDKTYRLTKTTNISVNNVSMGENVVLVNKSIAGATARVMYTSRLVLEQN
jgi:hypothetical protein